MFDHDAREAEALEALGARFMAALRLEEAGKLDEAEDELRAILRAEPRLPEPRMQLARRMLEAGRLDDAEENAREALLHLEKSGPWTDEIPPDTVRAVAHAQLAEILRRKADEDDLIFGAPEVFAATVEESRAHFEAAAALDPSDETSSYYAFFMGQAAAPPGLEIEDDGEEGDEDA